MTYILFYDLIIFYFDIYSNFIVKPHEAQMLQCRGQLSIGKPHGAQMLWCWGHLVCSSSEVENRTLSQMCGRLYSPILLLRVGLLTLMYITPFMALAIFCPSLSIILKLSSVVMWPVVFWCSKIGDDAFKCSLYCSSNVLADFPMYLSSYSVLPHLNQHIMLLCLLGISADFLEYSLLQNAPGYHICYKWSCSFHIGLVMRHNYVKLLQCLLGVSTLVSSVFYSSVFLFL